MRVIHYDAKSLDNVNDRITRAAIERDFVARADTRSIEIDGGLVATPVSDNRYTVIWQRNDDDSAQVKAVVTSQYGGEDPKTLSAKLHRIVRAQFHGEVTLD
jgi:hypothetical protein